MDDNQQATESIRAEGHQAFLVRILLRHGGREIVSDDNL